MTLSMRHLGELFCITWLLVGSPGLASADALRRASQAVQGNKNEQSKPRERSSSSQRSEPRSSGNAGYRQRDHHHHRHDHYRDDDEVYDDGDGETGRAIGVALLQVAMSPWLIPYIVTHQMVSRGDGIPSYPYADELAYTVPEDLNSLSALEVRKPFSLRMRLGATARNENLMSGTFAARADFAVPFALQVDYRVLTEAEGGARMYVGLGNAEALLRYADSPYLRFYTGLGYVQWADPEAVAHGIGFVYGFDAYPFRPISLGSRVSIGPLGQSYAFQWRSYLGVVISRWEVQVAYDHVDVGGAQLGGLQVGVEVHL